MGLEGLARQGGQSHPPLLPKIRGAHQQGCQAQWLRRWRGQGDQTIRLLPEAALPVRHEVRAQSMKRSPSGVGSGAQKQAVRPMRVIWPPQTKRPPHPRKGYSPRSLLLPHHQERPLRQPQPVFPLPEVGESSLPEGCRHAGAGAAGGLLPPSAQAGALQPSPWLRRSLQRVLCHQVRSL